MRTEIYISSADMRSGEILLLVNDVRCALSRISVYKFVFVRIRVVPRNISSLHRDGCRDFLYDGNCEAILLEFLTCHPLK